MRFVFTFILLFTYTVLAQSANAQNYPLEKIENGEWTLFRYLPPHDDTAFGFLADFFFDPDGTVYMTSRAGFTRYDGTKWTPLFGYGVTPENINSGFRQIQQTVRDKNGVFWFATDFGLMRYDGVKFTSYNTKEFASDDPNAPPVRNYVRNVAIDSNNHVWFVAPGYTRLNEFDGIDKWTHHSMWEEGISYFPANSGFMHIDKSANIWYMSNFNNHIIKYDRSKFELVDSLTAWPIEKNNSINAFFLDSKGNFWTGYFKNLIKYDGKDYTLFTPENTPALRKPEMHDSVRVYNITEDKQGNILMGFTNDILLKLSPKGEWTQYAMPAKSATMPNYIGKIKEDPQGNLWISTNEGITILKKTGTSVVIEEGSTASWLSVTIRSISPNPVSKSSVIEFSCLPESFATMTLKVYNCLGEMVLDFSKGVDYNPAIGKGNISVSRPEITGGMYFLVISDGKTVDAKLLQFE